MLGSILKNLVGYDGLIIILAIGNGVFIIPKLRSISYELRRQLQSTVYTPIEVLLQEKSINSKKSLDLNELQNLREKEVFYYHIFDTVNSIFPLMGILGTIIGLLRMVGMDTELVMSNFTIALTSTFWGLVFAIAYRAVDGIMVPVYYQNQENLQLIFERLDRFEKNNNEVLNEENG